VYITSINNVEQIIVTMVNVSSILTVTTTNFLKYIIMTTYSYTLLKISWRMFNKHFTELTKDQQEKVIERYYDYY